MNRHKGQNRLGQEGSLYLRQHAENPVHWWAWGEEAVEEAKRRDVPLFVSVGYSTCYWCHVMEREVFENERIAELMNERLVCVKVDREERGDVDGVYMMATQLMTGSGGWPMNVFLDHELRPFYCGTYFPPEGKWGKPGFGDVVLGMSDAWANRKIDVEDQAVKLADAVKKAMRGRGMQGRGLDDGVIVQAIRGLMRRYDTEWCGFDGGSGQGGGGPKFPQPVILEGLIEAWGWEEDEGVKGEMWEMVRETLLMMASGGIYDHLGGGFHRYSVDRAWVVPHFEKMGYDQGQLLSLYARAFEIEENENAKREYSRVMHGTCLYLIEQMQDVNGLFFSAEDAEVNGWEGKNYVWTKEEVHEAIGDERLEKVALSFFGFRSGANFNDPHHPEAQATNVLVRVDLRDGGYEEIDEVDYAEIVRLMKIARDQRKQAMSDEKVIVSWNGLIAGGLADAGRVLGEAKYVDAAKKCIGALMKYMVVDGQLNRIKNGECVSGKAMLEDYATLMHGLIRLIRADVESKEQYQTMLQDLHEQVLRKFEDEANGGYYDVEDDGGLFVRCQSVSDGAMPSGVGMMVLNGLDLFGLTGEDQYANRVVKDLRRYSEEIHGYGSGVMGLIQSLIRSQQILPSNFLDQLMHTSNSVETKDETDAWQVMVGVRKQNERKYELRLNLPEGGYIYGSQAEESGFIGLDVTLSKDDIERGWAVGVNYPPTHPKRIGDGATMMEIEVYEGEVVVELEISCGGEGLLESAVLQYQLCRDNQCMGPVQRLIDLK
ncbi:hypothetical protein KS4_22110 [Poriferisphaera corsica]|uniref:DUF255 domain-containing protein n=1 Tax=Poriferisphaera corsica TaxID=2528020 RepID=A0A517YV83_9BACT|nr:thioredoxin domain-containing protein [Poriferisphaera corsica]QDU34149.1 hypothetical protein KS4_22110 [Poriferisphaera corsica]